MTERKIGDKVLRLVRGDITDMEVEAFMFDITEAGSLKTAWLIRCKIYCSSENVVRRITR